MRVLRRAVVTAVAASAAIALSAGPSLAHECINASKQPGAGVQIIFGPEGAEWVSPGLQSRIDRGIVDLETGEGFHGLMGLDLDGDGAADVSIWLVGPEGEVPLQAQYNGPVCKGVTNIDRWFEECMAAV